MTNLSRLTNREILFQLRTDMRKTETVMVTCLLLMRKELMSALTDLNDSFNDLKAAVADETSRLDDLTAQLSAAHQADDTDEVEAVVSQIRDVTAGIRAKLAPAPAPVEDPATPAS